MPSTELSIPTISSYIFELLEEKSAQYNRPDFIAFDPISIPHRFSIKQDIEIMGFWAAVLAWGQRKTIINKCLELSALMDNAPYDFVINHQESDLKQFLNFKHRTFNATDTLYFIHFFKQYYRQHDSLEFAYSSHLKDNDDTIENALIGFHDLFFRFRAFPNPNTETHCYSRKKIFLQAFEHVSQMDGQE
jgi:uncharacterized protein (TIGR02757 family)